MHSNTKRLSVFLILLLVSVMILSSCTLLDKYLSGKEDADTSESSNKTNSGYNKINSKVFIIDASASMMAKSNNEDTRFERALFELEEDIEKTLELNNAEVSIILAHNKASYVIKQAIAASKSEIMEALKVLREAADCAQACSYGKADIEGAMHLAELVTAFTPDVEVVLYTDTSYANPGNVTVKNVCGGSDFNVAILDTRMIELTHGYTIEVDVVSYGINKIVTIYTLVEGTIGADYYSYPVSFELSISASLRNGEVTTISIPGYDESDFNLYYEYVNTFKTDYPYLYELTSYNSVTARVDAEDSFEYDDVFYLLGGEKVPIKILYSSDNQNSLFHSALRIVCEKLKYRRNVQFEEFVVIPGENEQKIPNYGYDFYIYEKYLPSSLPTDAVSIICDPLSGVDGAGFKLGTTTTPTLRTY